MSFGNGPDPDSKGSIPHGRCIGCRLKPADLNAPASNVAATNLWLIEHGAEIGWSDAARAALRARVCTFCGRPIDTRRRAWRERETLPDSINGLERGTLLRDRSGKIVETTGTYDVVGIAMEGGGRGTVNRIGVRYVLDPLRVVHYFERQFLDSIQ